MFFYLPLNKFYSDTNDMIQFTLYNNLSVVL